MCFSFFFFFLLWFCLNRRWWVMHFTSSSYVSEHYGVTHVRILSLLTKVKESVNGERWGE